jgi:hypothetical protein
VDIFKQCCSFDDRIDIKRKEKDSKRPIMGRWFVIQAAQSLEARPPPWMSWVPESTWGCRAPIICPPCAVTPRELVVFKRPISLDPGFTMTKDGRLVWNYVAYRRPRDSWISGAVIEAEGGTAGEDEMTDAQYVSMIVGDAEHQAIQRDTKKEELADPEEKPSGREDPGEKPSGREDPDAWAEHLVLLHKISGEDAAEFPNLAWDTATAYLWERPRQGRVPTARRALALANKRDRAWREASAPGILFPASAWEQQEQVRQREDHIQRRRTVDAERQRRYRAARRQDRDADQIQQQRAKDRERQRRHRARRRRLSEKDVTSR